MPDRATLYLLLEAKLGQPLDGYVAARRPELSWRRLAADIQQRTGVNVSWVSLWTWFGREERAA